MDTTNAMGQMFYEMISSGQLCQPEERIKFKAPLPKEHFHPFEENGMDFMQAMKLTHKALLKWLPIGKETSRFGFEYIKISRMIENAVTTLGRGLMTMRVHGMDLAEAPITIGELLKITSFHFQKSYQGAMAAINSGNQDAFMRLFTNQLRWLNMLQRLERTRDKLDEPIQPTSRTGKSTVHAPRAEALRPLDAPSAIGAPHAIGASRALRPLVPAPASEPEKSGEVSSPEKEEVQPAVPENVPEQEPSVIPAADPSEPVPQPIPAEPDLASLDELLSECGVPAFGNPELFHWLLRQMADPVPEPADNS